MRVAAGAIAFKILEERFPKLFIKASVIQIGEHKINKDNFSWNEVDNNPFFCADKETVTVWEKDLNSLRKNGNSTGAIIEIIAENVPKGIGSPIYKKLDSQIAEGLMSINAVKGVEIGSGFKSASSTGSENNDEIFPDNDGGYIFNTNNAGGILGGISTGQEIKISFAVKPTSSILSSRKTIDKFGKNTTISVKGRHDPCVGIRAVPIGEAMMHCVILDHYLMNTAQNKI